MRLAPVPMVHVMVMSGMACSSFLSVWMRPGVGGHDRLHP